MVLVYMLTWLGYIDGIHVTIYSSTMDPSWVVSKPFSGEKKHKNTQIYSILIPGGHRQGCPGLPERSRAGTRAACGVQRSAWAPSVPWHGRTMVELWYYIYICYIYIQLNAYEINYNIHMLLAYEITRNKLQLWDFIYSIRRVLADHRPILIHSYGWTQ